MKPEHEAKLVEIAGEGIEQVVISLKQFAKAKVRVEQVAVFFKNKEKLIPKNSVVIQGEVLIDKIKSLIVLYLGEKEADLLTNLVKKAQGIEHDNQEILDEVFNLVSGQYLAAVANLLQVSIPHSIPLHKKNIGKGEVFGTRATFSFNGKIGNILFITKSDKLTGYLDQQIL